MAAEVVPIVNCCCYGEDIEREDDCFLLQRHADVSLHVGLYSCMVYGTVSPFRNKYTFYTFPLESGGNIPNGCVGVTRPSRLGAARARLICNGSFLLCSWCSNRACKGFNKSFFFSGLK